LVDEVDAGGSDLLQATIHEVQRNRPVIGGAARQVIAESMPLGQWVIPHGYTVQVDIPLTHQNAYPDPGRFDPDRFLEASPFRCREERRTGDLPVTLSWSRDHDSKMANGFRQGRSPERRRDSDGSRSKTLTG